MFQSYALFPFLDVRENVAFGLRNRGVDKATIRRRVAEALELVHMTSFEKRRPGQLSGGQQQRVALARALVLDPAVLLLDEPLGALDAKLRRSLKVELKALQERVGITFLYVTHDQEEALTMSDRLAVMRAGKIVQMGAPKEIYNEPADTYVADFLGVSNLMEVDVIERGPGPPARSGSASPCWPPTSAARERPTARTPSSGRSGSGSSRSSPRRAGPSRPGRTGCPRWSSGWSTSARLPRSCCGWRPGMQVQALVQNDGDQVHLSHGTPVHVHLAPDALRVLAGEAISPTGEDLDTEQAAQHSWPAARAARSGRQRCRAEPHSGAWLDGADKR